MQKAMRQRTFIQWVNRTGNSHAYVRLLLTGMAHLLLNDPDLCDFFTFRIHDVHSAGHAGVEGMDRPKDLYRLLRVCDRSADERRLVRPPLPFGVARRTVPRARHDALIIRDLFVLDVDPMAEAAARGLVEPEALSLFGPGSRIPFLAVVNDEVPFFHVGRELIEPYGKHFRRNQGLDAAGRDTAERREERCRTNPQFLERKVHDLFHALVARGVCDEHA